MRLLIYFKRTDCVSLETRWAAQAIGSGFKVEGVVVIILSDVGIENIGKDVGEYCQDDLMVLYLGDE